METGYPVPPVHVHVAETTPVHVHMRRNPGRTPQQRPKDAQVKGEGCRSKGRVPWIPPGRLTCRRDGSYTSQRSRGGTRHQPDYEPQDRGLATVSKSLSALLREQDNERLSKRRDGEHSEPDELLRVLVEAEVDGVAVANQLTTLKETVDGLTREKRVSRTHAASLRRQKELLIEKMEIFDHTNHSLRELLREWRDTQKESLVRSEDKNTLQRRLADSEAENMRLLDELSYKDKEASKLAERLDFEKSNVKTTEELSRILESTHDHLESQLSQTEAEKACLATQIQRMQQSFNQQHTELQGLQEELHTLKQRREEEHHRQDRGALALLTRQAEQTEESARKLATKLQEKESQLAQALSTSNDWCLRLSKESSAKQQLEEDVSSLKLQVTELQASEDKLRAEREDLHDQLHQLSTENASVKMDNHRLKVQLTSSEEKLVALQADVRHLTSTVKQRENQTEKYKKKVQQARLKSDEYCAMLEMTQKEMQEVSASLEREKEQVKRELLVRLRDLETLPDKLRRTEQLLRDAQLTAEAHERRNAEHNSALAEVRLKVEEQGTQLEALQRRNLLLQEENNVLKERHHNLERKLEDMTLESQQASQALGSTEMSVRTLEHQLEEKTRECGVLSRQLQQSLDSAQQQVDDSMQRVLAKERVSQSKALDLQSQLSQARTELGVQQRSKEEMERRFQSQLKNMKDRLEQSDSTNRSLQNYVQFLKTSYGNVFGDSLLSS